MFSQLRFCSAFLEDAAALLFAWRQFVGVAPRHIHDLFFRTGCSAHGGGFSKIKDPGDPPRALLRALYHAGVLFATGKRS